MTPIVSFHFDGLGDIIAVLGEVSILPGPGAHRLSFPVQLTGTWLDPEERGANAPVLLTGTAWTEQPSPSWLAELQTQVFAVRGYNTTENLSFDLSDDQLLAIERLRGADDLGLRLKLQIALVQAPSGTFPLAERQTPVLISRSQWLEVLDQVGTEVGIVLRVPSPLTDSALQPAPLASADDAASRSQANARLRQARAELRDHQWEHCVATCRRVLENIALLVTIPPAKQIFSINADDRTQDQRWAAIYHDVKGMTHAAHHDDKTTTGFNWTRADAETILAATGGLLLRYTAQ